MARNIIESSIMPNASLNGVEGRAAMVGCCRSHRLRRPVANAQRSVLTDKRYDKLVSRFGQQFIVWRTVQFALTEHGDTVAGTLTYVDVMRLASITVF